MNRQFGSLKPGDLFISKPRTRTYSEADYALTYSTILHADCSVGLVIAGVVAKGYHDVEYTDQYVLVVLNGVVGYVFVDNCDKIWT